MTGSTRSGHNRDGAGRIIPLLVAVGLTCGVLWLTFGKALSAVARGDSFTGALNPGPVGLSAVAVLGWALWLRSRMRISGRQIRDLREGRRASYAGIDSLMADAEGSLRDVPTLGPHGQGVHSTFGYAHSVYVDHRRRRHDLAGAAERGEMSAREFRARREALETEDLSTVQHIAERVEVAAELWKVESRPADEAVSVDLWRNEYGPVLEECGQLEVLAARAAARGTTVSVGELVSVTRARVEASVAGATGRPGVVEDVLAVLDHLSDELHDAALGIVEQAVRSAHSGAAHSSATLAGLLAQVPEATNPYDRYEGVMVDLPGFGTEDATSDGQTLYDDINGVRVTASQDIPGEYLRLLPRRRARVVPAADPAAEPWGPYSSIHRLIAVLDALPEPVAV